MYYCAGTYHGLLGRGELYDSLCPVFLIGILNFRLEHADETLWGSEHVVSEYRMIEKRTGELAPPTISCIFAELGRFDKPLYECRSDRDALFYMIRHGSVLEELPGELAHRPYAEALAEACEIALFPKDKKLIYDEDMISERDIAAKCQYAFGEGEAKGRAEGQKEIATNMLSAGLPVSQIANCTGLSEEEVLALR